MLVYLQPHVTLPTSQHAAGPRTPQMFSSRLVYSRYWKEASKRECAEVVREGFFDIYQYTGKFTRPVQATPDSLFPSTPH